MPLLFRIYRDKQQELWIVLMADQLYGEYLDKVRAVLGAIETAEESRLAVSKSKYGTSPRGYTKCAMRYSDKPAWLHKKDQTRIEVVKRRVNPCERSTGRAVLNNLNRCTFFGLAARGTQQWKTKKSAFSSSSPTPPKQGSRTTDIAPPISARKQKQWPFRVVLNCSGWPNTSSNWRTGLR